MSDDPGTTTILFEFKCSKTWRELRPTADPARRWCGTCEHEVTLCEDIESFKATAAQRGCIALNISGTHNLQQTVGLPAGYSSKIAGMLGELEKDVNDDAGEKL